MNFKNAVFRNKDLVLVFLLTFVLFSAVQFSTEDLLGNDSYLYVRLAELTKNHGFLREFPWLSATIMKDNFTGLHFLYYVLLIPFTFLGDLIFGAKVASLIFLSTMAVVFYKMLKVLNLKHGFFWYIFLLSSSGYFLLRMNFARPLCLSVIFSLLVFYALVKNNNILLFIVSFLFVWAHGSFPLAIFITMAFVLASYVYSKRIYYGAFLSSLFGIASAVIVNPFFPANINYFNIYFSTSIPYSATSVISEWQPINIIDLVFFDAPLVSLPFLALVAVFCMKFVINVVDNEKRQGKIEDGKNEMIIAFLAVVSTVFFVMTLIIGRFIDYWVPFGIFFVAAYSEFLYNELSESSFFEKIRTLRWPKFFSAEDARLTAVILMFFVLGLSLWNKTNFILHSAKHSEKENRVIREASLWLRENTPKNSIVFDVNWGDFSRLFFYNTHNYYVAGLDLKFLYLVSSEKYWLYNHIGEGVVCGKEVCEEKDTRSIYDVVKKEFNADYVLVPTIYKEFDYANLINYLDSDPRFKKVYENEGEVIWAAQIPRHPAYQDTECRESECHSEQSEESRRKSNVVHIVSTLMSQKLCFPVISNLMGNPDENSSCVF